MLLFICRKYCLDSSDGVGSEGEVDEWLRNVAGQWCCRGGWVMRLERHGRRSRRWVVDGAVCLQRGCRGCGSGNIIPSFEKRVLMEECIYNADRARMGSGNGIGCESARTRYAMVCRGRAMAMLVRA